MALSTFWARLQPAVSKKSPKPRPTALTGFSFTFTKIGKMDLEPHFHYSYHLDLLFTLAHYQTSHDRFDSSCWKSQFQSSRRNSWHCRAWPTSREWTTRIRPTTSSQVQSSQANSVLNYWLSKLVKVTVNFRLGNFDTVDEKSDFHMVKKEEGSRLAAYASVMFDSSLTWKDIDWLKR